MSSWLRRHSSMRVRSGPTATILKNADPDAVLDAFREHWLQAAKIMDTHHKKLSLESPSESEVSTVLNHLEQMVNYVMEEATLLALEERCLPSAVSSSQQQKQQQPFSSPSSSFCSSSPPAKVSPILDYLLSEHVLQRLFEWSTKTGSLVPKLKEEQLRIYEILVSHSSHELLFHGPFVKPLLDLLKSCEECCPPDLERRLVVLLNTLCVTLSQHSDLLQVFFCVGSDQEPASNCAEPAFDLGSPVLRFGEEQSSSRVIPIPALLTPIDDHSLPSCDDVLLSDASLRSDDANATPCTDDVTLTVGDVINSDVITGLDGDVIQGGYVIQRDDDVIQRDDDVTQRDVVPTNDANNEDLQLSNDSLEFDSNFFSSSSVATASISSSSLLGEKKRRAVRHHFCTGEHCINDWITVTMDTVNDDAGFLVLSLLIPFVHRDGIVGQQARDALLLCMSLARKNDTLGAYVAKHSNFCPVLATGLSGLYSVLPRRLSITAEDWFRLTKADVKSICELQMFVNSLEFCNAVAQVSHPLVREQLLDYMTQGFLVPVLGPALYQSTAEELMTAASEEEMITSTVYLEYFLRTVTDNHLLRVFLHFLLTAKDDDKGTSLLDIFAMRIGTHSKLCLVTLSLFRTLLELNCEDVMLELVLKYLIPCTHLMVSQRCRVRDIDLYCSTAQRLLSLIPAVCYQATPPQAVTSSHHQATPPTSQTHHPVTFSYAAAGAATTNGALKSRTFMTSNGDAVADTTFTTTVAPPMTPPTDAPILLPTPEEDCASYLRYLMDARIALKSARDACRSWSRPYDGIDPPPYGLSAAHAAAAAGDLIASPPTNNVNGVVGPSGENVAIFRHLHDDDAVSDISREGDSGIFVGNGVGDGKTLPEVTSSSGGGEGVSRFSPPDVGPFLSLLLTRLEMMCQNDVYVNLQLTALIARLAHFPQPILRSFLLSQTLVFQPTVRSLFQVLGSLKHKVDSLSYSIPNFQSLIARGRHFFKAREELLSTKGAVAPPSNATTPGGVVTSTPDPRSELSVRMSRSQSAHADISGGGSGGTFPPRSGGVLNGTPPSSNSKKRSGTISNFFRRLGTPTISGASPPVPPSPSGHVTFLGNSTSLYSIADESATSRQSRADSCSESVDSEDSTVEMERARVRNTVFAVIILEEFLKELAAISQEHALLQLHDDMQMALQSAPPSLIRPSADEAT